MKLLTLNFLTCARKACKQEPAAFPLHPRDADLERVDQELNPEFLINVLPRLDWKAIKSLSEEVCPLLPTSACSSQPPPLHLCTSRNIDTNRKSQLGLPTLPDSAPEESDLLDAETKQPTQTLQDLHALLVETSVADGKLVCGHCGHEYAVKEGIANFLLPSHLV
jgi:multifunctional methyltransferase subunit TRM112